LNLAADLGEAGHAGVKEGNVPQRIETATLAGGCFWCLEAVFERLNGVQKVVSGYTGGKHPNPSYEAVCTGVTGHAEAVRVTFDSQVLSYRDLLELFFAFHDPTTLNRQGADAGTQYRSAIFPNSPEHRATAEALIAELTQANAFDRPIVTTIEPEAPFYDAEAYHQGYYREHPNQPYCTVVISPKIAKLRAKFSDRLKPLVKA
jgi:peptide-methionine (S)-S-oxide reductase